MDIAQSISKITDEIADKGWSITPDFFPEDYTRALFQESKALWNEGEFRKAGVGVGKNLQVRPEIRSDNVLWLNPDELSANQQAYWDTIDILRKSINESFYLNLSKFEAHFAVYQPGSFYKKHLDQFKDVKYRLISCILYLNFDWKAHYGGQLRIYQDDTFTDFTPSAGTFACFRSDTIYHEVLSCSKTRYSLTGWLRRNS